MAFERCGMCSVGTDGDFSSASCGELLLSAALTECTAARTFADTAQEGILPTTHVLDANVVHGQTMTKVVGMALLREGCLLTADQIRENIDTFKKAL